MRLELAYPDELDAARKKRVPLFIPVGVIEYHSAHLPLGTDVLVVYEFLKKLEEKCGIIIAPPIWYGPASYAVRGPEGYSIDMDGETLNHTMYNIYMSLLRSGWRNVWTVMAHQTETPNPTETACLDASRRVLFAYLEETRGRGWWGKNESSEFYGTLEADENPWNWLRVSPLAPRTEEFISDHAGEHETSELWGLMPECVRIDKIGTSSDWFAATAYDASYEKGQDKLARLLSYWLKTLG